MKEPVKIVNPIRNVLSEEKWSRASKKNLNTSIGTLKACTKFLISYNQTKIIIFCMHFTALIRFKNNYWMSLLLSPWMCVCCVCFIGFSLTPSSHWTWAECLGLLSCRDVWVCVCAYARHCPPPFTSWRYGCVPDL